MRRALLVGSALESTAACCLSSSPHPSGASKSATTRLARLIAPREFDRVVATRQCGHVLAAQGGLISWVGWFVPESARTLGVG